MKFGGTENGSTGDGRQRPQDFVRVFGGIKEGPPHNRFIVVARKGLTPGDQKRDVLHLKGSETSEVSLSGFSLTPHPGDRFFHPSEESLEHMNYIAKKLPEVQETIPQVEGVAFFGSRIRGEERTDPDNSSDLDTIVFYDGSEFEIDESIYHLSPSGGKWHEYTDAKREKKGARISVVYDIKNRFSGLMRQRGLPIDVDEGTLVNKSVLIRDISPKETDRALDVFTQYVNANTNAETGKVMPDGINGPTFDLVCRFLPSVGDGIQQNRAYILRQLEERGQKSEKYLQALIDCLSEFGSQSDSEGTLPKTIVEAKAYYNIN